jgi:type II secretory pathway pseudopilin PulG
MIAIILILLVVAIMWAMRTSEEPASGGKASNMSAIRILTRAALRCMAVLILILFLIGILIPPRPGGIRYVGQSAAMQTTRALALAMFEYANDNNEQYPDGASSTEVFQKLMDGNYISDPSIFFVALPGKVRAESGAKLKPENVAYDVTSGVDAHSPDDLPLVFLTGFRIDYHAGASAVSLVKPFPSTAVSLTSWFSHRDEPSTTFEGLPISYKSNNAFFRVTNAGGHPTQYTPDGYGIVPNVVETGFDPGGKVYHQLTPDGVLK